MKNELISHRTFLQPLFEDFDKFFSDPLIPQTFKESKWDVRTTYSTKVFRDEKGEYLGTEILIPGYSKEELKVSIIANKFLQVEGIRKSDNRKFKFTNTINELCDLNSLKAECKDGLLNITMRLIGSKDIPIE